MKSANDVKDNGVRVVYIYPTVRLDLKCPVCGHESTVVLKKPISRPIKALCKKCGQAFIVSPSKRALKRKPLDIDALVDIKPITGKGRSASIVRTVDISQGGMGITVPKRLVREKNLKEDDTLYLHFTLPGMKRGSSLLVKGRVRNIVQSGALTGELKVGLEFVGLDEHSQKNIGFYMWD